MSKNTENKSSWGSTALKWAGVLGTGAVAGMGVLGFGPVTIPMMGPLSSAIALGAARFGGGKLGATLIYKAASFWPSVVPSVTLTNNLAGMTYVATLGSAASTTAAVTTNTAYKAVTGTAKMVGNLFTKENKALPEVESNLKVEDLTASSFYDMKQDLSDSLRMENLSKSEQAKEKINLADSVKEALSNSAPSFLDNEMARRESKAKGVDSLMNSFIEI
ncbi:MAG: hypothetical protein J0H68_02660 [Sphingobacteriia bacterium]|nr:hypothetical protein [Sphingobacteriia bacterium]